MSTSDNRSSSPKMYVLMSSDKETFEVEEAVAVQSQMIKRMIDDDCFDPAIPLPSVTSKILSKVIEYCKRHMAAEDGLEAFDAEFVKVDHTTLIDLLLAANSLGVKNLVDLTCKAVADMLKGKSVEQMREIFKIENDFTAEEEAEIRRENAWAFV